MTTKQREAISTIWQLFRDYFEEGSGSLRSNDDDLIEQLDIYAREEKIMLLERLINSFDGEITGNPYGDEWYEGMNSCIRTNVKVLQEELKNLKG